MGNTSWRQDSIEAVLADVRAGRPVIVTDDADRENEGDLILAAEKATAENVAFMVRHTSGVICVLMKGEDLDRLEIPLMTPHAANTERMGSDASFDDPQCTQRHWNGAQAYSDTKLQNLWLAFGVARRWPDTPVNAVSPGWVATRMGGAGASDDLD